VNGKKLIKATKKLKHMVKKELKVWDFDRR